MCALDQARAEVTAVARIGGARSQGFELLRSKSSGFDSTCPIDL
jgi:hypothetical protein